MSQPVCVQGDYCMTLGGIRSGFDFVSLPIQPTLWMTMRSGATYKPTTGKTDREYGAQSFTVN